MKKAKITASPKPIMAPSILLNPLIIEIFIIPKIGLNIRLHNLKTIPMPISPTTHTVKVLNVLAITLLIVKKTRAMQTQETAIDKIFTISFTMPF